MLTPQNTAPNDNQDENETDSGNHARNHQIGAELAQQTNNADQGNNPRTAGEINQPLTSVGTPNYGTFGVATDASTTEVLGAAGTNPGGAAAPSTADAGQRGSAAQNRNTKDVLNTQDAEYDERRDAEKQDDPRYGSGTRNWPTEEPANRTMNRGEDSATDVNKE